MTTVEDKFAQLDLAVAQRITTVAQRVAAIEDTVNTLLVPEVNNISNRLASLEGSTVTQVRVDRIDSDMQQLLGRLESIITQMAAETQSRNEAVKAAIDQMQLGLNQAQAQMIQTMQADAGQWVMADVRLTTKFQEIDNNIGMVNAAMEAIKAEVRSVPQSGQRERVREDKNITEYKIVNSLVKLTNERREYKSWQDKFKECS